MTPFLDRIKGPTLILNEEKAKENIRKMADKIRASGTVFRPHFKTHQSLEIGEWFRQAGVDRITVSSIEMAEYFSDQWDDILIAFPVNLLEADRIESLCQKIKLSILVSDIHAAQVLSEMKFTNLNVWLEIDTGDGRSGIRFSEMNTIKEAAYLLKESAHNFAGLLTHSGHTYAARGKEEVSKIFRTGIELLNEIRSHLDIDGLLCSSGDTPGCSLSDDLGGVDELRPGNFIFYDQMQLNIGSCSLDDISLLLMAPIVARYPDDIKYILHAGAVHLSKDKTDGFGEVFKVNRETGCLGQHVGHVSSISQEHAILNTDLDLSEDEVMAIVPVHSCLCADLMGDYLTLDGRIIKSMRSRKG